MPCTPSGLLDSKVDSTEWIHCHLPFRRWCRKVGGGLAACDGDGVVVVVSSGAMVRFVAAALRGRLKNLPVGFPIRNFHRAIFAFKSFGRVLVASGVATRIEAPAESHNKQACRTAKIRNSPPTSGTSPGAPH